MNCFAQTKINIHFFRALNWNANSRGMIIKNGSIQNPIILPSGLFGNDPHFNWGVFTFGSDYCEIRTVGDDLYSINSGASLEFVDYEALSTSSKFNFMAKFKASGLEAFAQAEHQPDIFYMVRCKGEGTPVQLLKQHLTGPDGNLGSLTMVTED